MLTQRVDHLRCGLGAAPQARTVARCTLISLTACRTLSLWRSPPTLTRSPTLARHVLSSACVHTAGRAAR